MKFISVLGLETDREDRLATFIEVWTANSGLEPLQCWHLPTYPLLGAIVLLTGLKVPAIVDTAVGRRLRKRSRGLLVGLRQ